MKIYSRIIGTGSYLPARIVSNEELAKTVETSHDWIVERTGIHNRHIAAPEETTSSMAYQAALKALEAAQIEAKDLDMIIVATTTPDQPLPTAACLLQEKLGAQGIPVFDIGAACAGFIYGLSVADQFIKTGHAKTVMVIGAELMSSILDWQDRSTCILFGDGAGCAILQASEQPGIVSTHLHADGRYKDKIYVPTGITSKTSPEHPTYVHMQGQEVFRFAINALGDVVDETLAANQLEKSAIDWLIPHQANLRIIAATAKKLDLPLDRVILTVQDHANTSAASIPLALDQGIRDGRIQRGQTLLLEGIGAGFAWGSALVVY